MSELFKADTIYDYNEWAGVETRHPLVGFIDFSQVKPLHHARKYYGFYAVFLKDVKCGELRYGRQYYDYQVGTLIFVAPGQTFGAEDDGEVFQPTGYLLMFHPDLLRNTPLGKVMKDYTFFLLRDQRGLAPQHRGTANHHGLFPQDTIRTEACHRPPQQGSDCGQHQDVP